MSLSVLQVLPALEAGGVERGTVEVARALVAHGHRALVVSRGGRLVDALTAAGAEHHELPVGSKSPRSLLCIGALRDLMSRQVDVVHVRSRLPAWIAYFAWRGLPAETRPSFVTTVHGPYSVNRYSAIMTRGERVIAISSMIRDYILGNYPRVDPARVSVIHRGVDPGEFPHGYQPAPAWRQALDAEHPHLADRRLVTLPARITRWKGHEDFLELIARLRAQGLPVHGLIAGGVEPRRRRFMAALVARRRALGLDDAVTFLGHRDDLREILASSAVVVSLSREPEAFGRTTLEALSLGRPVVGYAHGGVAEVLAAMFPRGAVEPGNPRQAADRVAEFLAARPEVAPSTAFTLERMLRATLALYEDVAAGRHRAHDARSGARD